MIRIIMVMIMMIMMIMAMIGMISCLDALRERIREGFKKSKWKFKMAFAMKGGGVWRGSQLPHTYFEKLFFLKTI